MKKNIVIISIILLFGCSNPKPNNLMYEDSSNKFHVIITEYENDKSIDSLYSLNELDDPTSTKEVGYIKNGFRNGTWVYNLDTAIRKIEWGHYKDKDLNFEISTFVNIDTIKHGDMYSKLQFITDSGNINLIVSINGSLKDSLPETNYEQFLRNDVNKVGGQLLDFNILKVRGLFSDVYICNIALQYGDSKKRYFKSVFSYIDKDHFVDVAVSSGRQNDFYANELFDAVLTDFRLNGKKLIIFFFSKA